MGDGFWHQGDDGLWWVSEAVVYPDEDFASLILANRQADAATGAEYQALTDSVFAEIRQRLRERFAPTAVSALISETRVPGVG